MQFRIDEESGDFKDLNEFYEAALQIKQACPELFEITGVIMGKANRRFRGGSRPEELGDEVEPESKKELVDKMDAAAEEEPGSGEMKNVDEVVEQAKEGKPLFTNERVDERVKLHRFK